MKRRFLTAMLAAVFTIALLPSNGVEAVGSPMELYINVINPANGTVMVDLVNGYEPVSPTFVETVPAIEQKLRALPSNERAAELAKNPQLFGQFVNEFKLKYGHEIAVGAKVSNMKLSLGTLKDAIVNDGDGNLNRGPVLGRLIGEFDVELSSGAKMSYTLTMACMNKVVAMELNGAKLDFILAYTPDADAATFKTNLSGTF